ncbi:hypothetical protein ACUIJ5_30860 (plasmid) [Bacillus toyonensis]
MISIGIEVKYQWTTSIFNYKGKGEEWITGYLETEEAVIGDLIGEGTSGFILLDNPIVKEIFKK